MSSQSTVFNYALSSSTPRLAHTTWQDDGEYDDGLARRVQSALACFRYCSWLHRLNYSLYHWMKLFWLLVVIPRLRTCPGTLLHTSAAITDTSAERRSGCPQSWLCDNRAVESKTIMTMSKLLACGMAMPRASRAGTLLGYRARYTYDVTENEQKKGKGNQQNSAHAPALVVLLGPSQQIT